MSGAESMSDEARIVRPHPLLLVAPAANRGLWQPVHGVRAPVTFVRLRRARVHPDVGIGSQWRFGPRPVKSHARASARGQQLRDRLRRPPRR
jgi:hypothetical protein